MNLKDKVAIVTGSSRGIGREIADTFAAHGATVVVCSTKEDTAIKIADEIKQAHGHPTLGIGGNVSEEADVLNLVKQTIEKFGRIDILVNNAGITRDNLLLRLSKKDWSEVIDTNLNSIFFATKAVLRPMLKQKGGRIINIASIVGVIGNPGQANYAASKGGMIAFTKSIAKEYAKKGIITNVIAPGFIETDMINSLPEQYLDNIISTIPMGRLGKSSEIANLALFLASEYAQYSTGQVFQIDGGLAM